MISASVCSTGRGSLGRAPAVRPMRISSIGSVRTRVLEKAREGNGAADEEELRRLQSVDAFAELKAMATKQSVNRPQKVRRGRQIWLKRTRMPFPGSPAILKRRM